MTAIETRAASISTRCNAAIPLVAIIEIIDQLLAIAEACAQSPLAVAARFQDPDWIDQERLDLRIMQFTGAGSANRAIVLGAFLAEGKTVQEADVTELLAEAKTRKAN